MTTPVIDCHGHYTTAPAALDWYRREQLAALDGSGSPAAPPVISDDEIRHSVETGQLRLMRERGIDLTLLSPKASAMGHHVDDQPTATAWAQTSNDLVHRVVGLYPGNFRGVCQLPQVPGGDLGASVRELRRCVTELGFVGANVNPDPSGGFWSGPPLTDPHWFPLYEELVELNVPAMIHVSGSGNANAPTLSAHYLNADTAAFAQLLEGDLFSRFPGLRLVIPHGGGAVPYHWGRFYGLANRLERPTHVDSLLENVFFDSCVYHQPGLDLLLAVVGVDNVLFASEMLGAVRGNDPRTGHSWDDTRRYVERAGLTGAQLSKVYYENVCRVYPRLVISELPGPR